MELGIVDIREIIRVISKVYGYDFSSFALTSFKYNLERVISKNALLSSESLFRRLSEDKDFFDIFLNDIFLPSSEMFRDPSLWRWLREDYFPNLESRHFDNFKIWIPQCVSGSELYTLLILLQEMDLVKKVKIFATVYSDKSLNYIKSGNYPLKKLEVSKENYKRFHGLNDFDKYYRIEGGEVFRDTSLISNVEFIKDDINFSYAPQNLKLVLFRNAMIYYNPTMQGRILDKMNKCLSAAGNLIIGIKETIKSSSTISTGFELVNESESVYKRRL